MIWFRLALKNILRRKARSLITLLGMTAAITVLYSLLEFQHNYQANLQEDIAGLGAQIMVVPKGCPYEAATIALHGGKWPRYIKEDYLSKIRGTQGIDQVAGIIMDAVFDTEQNRNRIYVGIDEEYPELRANWKLQGTWFMDDSSIILGSTVAREEALNVGEKYFLEEKDLYFTVSGIIERTNTQDDGFYFLPRKTMQQVFNLEEKLVVILVKVTDVGDVDELTITLRESERDLNIFPLTELVANISGIIQNTRVFIFAVVLVAVFTALMGILNTILMTVFERFNEIGMMKALGASRSDIFKLIWAETVVLAGLGGIAGVVVALIGARLVSTFISMVLPYAPNGVLIGFSPWYILISVLFSIGVGLVAGFYPAYKASSVKPMVAIRTE